MAENVQSVKNSSPVAVLQIVESDDSNDDIIEHSLILNIVEDAFSEKDRNHQQILLEPDIKTEKNWLFDEFETLDCSNLAPRNNDVKSGFSSQSVKTAIEEGRISVASGESVQILFDDDSGPNKTDCKQDKQKESTIDSNPGSFSQICARCAYYMGENNILKRQLEEASKKMEQLKRREYDRSRNSHSRDRQRQLEEASKTMEQLKRREHEHSRNSHSRDRQFDKKTEVRDTQRFSDRRKPEHSIGDRRGRKRNSPSPVKKRRDRSTARLHARSPRRSLPRRDRSLQRSRSRAFVPKRAHPLSPIRSLGRLEQGTGRPHYRADQSYMPKGGSRAPNPPLTSASPWNLPSLNLMPQQKLCNLPYAAYVSNAPLIRADAHGSQGSDNSCGQGVGKHRINLEYGYVTPGLPAAEIYENPDFPSHNKNGWSLLAANRGTHDSIKQSYGGSSGFEKEQEWLNSFKR